MYKLVNTPMMSEQKKWKIEDEITKLTAERDVLDWKNSHLSGPTVENYETQMRYYDDLWNQNLDAILNGLRKDTVKQGSDEWYALLKKGDDILERRNAYNKGMMGLLDGQKAQMAQEQAVTQTGGGTRSVSSEEARNLKYLSNRRYTDNFGHVFNLYPKDFFAYVKCQISSMLRIFLLLQRFLII